MAGAGIGAAAGGLLGALASLGIPESEARYFETGFRAGGILVTVEAGARVLEAMAILDRHGADTGPATGPGPSGADAYGRRSRQGSRLIRPVQRVALLNSQHKREDALGMSIDTRFPRDLPYWAEASRDAPAS